MKRALASLASVVTLTMLASPAFAYSVGRDGDHPRMDQRGVKSAALASYLGRHNRTYVRSRYHELVQRVVPSLLAVTGGRMSTDYAKISRPGTRMIDDWALMDHCVINGPLSDDRIPNPNRCTELGW